MYEETTIQARDTKEAFASNGKSYDTPDEVRTKVSIQNVISELESMELDPDNRMKEALLEEEENEIMRKRMNDILGITDYDPADEIEEILASIPPEKRKARSFIFHPSYYATYEWLKQSSIPELADIFFDELISYGSYHKHITDDPFIRACMANIEPTINNAYSNYVNKQFQDTVNQNNKDTNNLKGE